MQYQQTGLPWALSESGSSTAGGAHLVAAVKKVTSPGLGWRSWRTIGSQSRESFTLGQTSDSPSNTQGKSRMHKGARTDPCGGREATRVPTATNSGKKVNKINGTLPKVSTTAIELRRPRALPVR